MRKEETIKHETILEVASRRFSHFGIDKTTVTEIAEDLGISKQSLFYYYHDKNSLIKAVVEKIINEFEVATTRLFQTAPSLEAALLGMIELKRSFFKQYQLMAVPGNKRDLNNLKPALTGLYNNARKTTCSLISEMIKKGIQTNELECADPEETSELIIEMFTAFEHCNAQQNKVPDEQQFDQLFDKQKQVLKLIVNGLKTKHETTNA
ncbi:TetR/AcrR family transcriptional regulator [Segetibacter sp. 3557_3]|uniref:TetR/AcrR family transcriptional regulator n=1 Tax=Segetibacter sp. 3557_3 TaxID=2547429 RepID=UPI0010588102|nr:TetR/AcrR family transcriptional regulator [Segetibacter sp. 3557_3]TDH28775.1 TetR/AcrR family transcriptional regulator [Segetibacter sp. 3557_3]